MGKMSELDIELRNAGIDPAAEYPLDGRRVWLSPFCKTADGALRTGRDTDIIDAVDTLGGQPVLALENADLLIVPDGTCCRYEGAVAAWCKAEKIGIVSESAILLLAAADVRPVEVGV